MEPAFKPTQPPVKRVPGVRQWRHEADNPHDFSAKVVNVWGIASAPVSLWHAEGHNLDLDQNQSKCLAFDWIM